MSLNIINKIYNFFYFINIGIILIPFIYHIIIYFFHKDEGMLILYLIHTFLILGITGCIMFFILNLIGLLYFKKRIYIILLFCSISWALLSIIIYLLYNFGYVELYT